MGQHSRQITDTADRIREEMEAWLETAPYDVEDLIEEEKLDAFCMEQADYKYDDYMDSKYEQMKDERMERAYADK